MSVDVTPGTFDNRDCNRSDTVIWRHLRYSDFLVAALARSLGLGFASLPVHPHAR